MVEDMCVINNSKITFEISTDGKRTPFETLTLALYNINFTNNLLV